jgi:RHS repeat-associated protein
VWAAASSVGLALCSAASLVIVLASCGKNDPMLRDISMPIDDFPPSAELYLHDVQGTPVARVDALGSVVAEAATHPYGAVRYESGSVEPYGFVGNERDFGAGVSDFQARPYRPELSRFLAVDPVPLFEPEAFNEPFRWQAYTYAAGDPVNGVDADGRFVLALRVSGNLAFIWGGSASVGVYVSIGGGARTTVGFVGSAEGQSGAFIGAGLQAERSVMPVGNYHDLESSGEDSLVVGGSAGPVGGNVNIPLAAIRGKTLRGVTLSQSVGVGANMPVSIGISRSWSKVLDVRDTMDELDRQTGHEEARQRRMSENNRAGRHVRVGRDGRTEEGRPNASRSVGPVPSDTVSSCSPPDDC